jgi:hypothetical protein
MHALDAVRSRLMRDGFRTLYTVNVWDESQRFYEQFNNPNSLFSTDFWPSFCVITANLPKRLRNVVHKHVYRSHIVME